MPARSTSARSRSASQPLARALADAAGGNVATVPQIGEATYAAKIVAADRLLDPARPARALHDLVRALSPHIGARLALDGAPHTVWRTAVHGDGPAPGTLALADGALVLGCATGGLEIVELQPPGGRRMPAADWLRGLRGALPGGDGPVSAARTLALRVVTRVFDEGAYADRAFTGEAEKAKVDARDRALAMHLAFGTVQRRRTLDAALEDIAGRPVQRLERRLAHVLQLGRLPDPLRRRNSGTCSGFRERRARAAHRSGRARPASRMPCCGASPPRVRTWYAALPDEDAEDAGTASTRCPTGSPSSGSTPTARSGGGRCAPPPTVRRRSRCGRTRCSTAPPPWRPGWTRPGPIAVRDDATGVLRVEGPLDVAGSHAFASGAVVPIARAAVLIAQSVGAEPGMRVLDLCAAPGGKTAVLAATGAQVTAVDAHPARAQGAARDPAPARRRRRGRDGGRPRVPRRAVRADPDRRARAAASACSPAAPMRAGAARPRTPTSSRPCRSSSSRTPASCSRPAASCTTRSARSTRRRTRTSRPAAGLVAHDELRTWPDEGDDGFYAARLAEG